MITAQMALKDFSQLTWSEIVTLGEMILDMCDVILKYYPSLARGADGLPCPPPPV